MVDTSGSMPPGITFPCDYPIKVIGGSASDFQEYVLSVVKQFDPEHDGCSDIQLSSNGKYTSVKLMLKATSEDQIRQLFEALKKSGRVQIVL